MDSVSQEFHTRPVVDASTCETASRSEIDPPRVAFAARPMGGPVTADDFREIASAVRAVPAKERPAHKAAVRRAANAKRPYLERSDRAVLDRVLDEWLIWSQGHTRGDLTLDKRTADKAGMGRVTGRPVPQWCTGRDPVR